MKEPNGRRCLECEGPLVGTQRKFCGRLCLGRHWRANNLDKARAKVLRWHRSPRGRYMAQRYQAKLRGVEWLFTFETWMLVWEESGHWDERGSGKYMMCRRGDSGPYALGNVYIGTAADNINDRYRYASSQ